jgi:hypothetical protein
VDKLWPFLDLAEQENLFAGHEASDLFDRYLEAAVTRSSTPDFPTMPPDTIDEHFIVQEDTHCSVD